ncbi:MAG: hypothetical protein ACI81R_000927 [Bradymonadia bacterium]
MSATKSGSTGATKSAKKASSSAQNARPSTRGLSAAAPPAISAPPAADYWAACAIVAVVALLAIWGVIVPPGVDMPLHLVSADVLARPDIYADRFEPNLALTSQGFVWLSALFIRMGADLIVAGKCSLSVWIFATMGSAYLGGRLAGQTRPIAAVVGAGMIATFIISMGFVNFAFAIPGALIMSGAASAALRGERAHWATVAVIGLLTAVAHIIVAAFALLHIAWQAVIEPGERSRIKDLAVTVGAGIPAGLTVLFLAWRARSDFESVAEGLGAQRLSAADQVTNWVALSWGGFTSLGVLVCIAVLISVLKSASSARWRVAATMAFWTLVYIALPFHGEGWAYAQPRALVFVWFVPLLWVPWSGLARRQLWLTTAAVVVTIGGWASGAAPSAWQIADIRLGFGPANAGVTTIATLEGGTLDTCEYVSPLQHAGAYALPSGARTEDRFLFNPTIHSMRPVAPEGGWPESLPQFLFAAHQHCEGPEACLQASIDVADRVAVGGLSRPSVVIVAPDEAQVQRLIQRGARPLPGANPLTAGGGSIVSFLQSGVNIEIFPSALGDSATAPPAVTVRAGYPGGESWIAGRTRPPIPLVEIERLGLGPLPGGPIEVQLVIGETVLRAQIVDVPVGGAAVVRFE